MYHHSTCVLVCKAECRFHMHWRNHQVVYFTFQIKTNFPISHRCTIGFTFQIKTNCKIANLLNLLLINLRRVESDQIWLVWVVGRLPRYCPRTVCNSMQFHMTISDVLNLDLINSIAIIWIAKYFSLIPDGIYIDKLIHEMVPGHVYSFMQILSHAN